MRTQFLVVICGWQMKVAEDGMIFEALPPVAANLDLKQLFREDITEFQLELLLDDAIEIFERNFEEKASTFSLVLRYWRKRLWIGSPQNSSRRVCYSYSLARLFGRRNGITQLFTSTYMQERRSIQILSVQLLRGLGRVDPTCFYHCASKGALTKWIYPYIQLGGIDEQFQLLTMNFLADFCAAKLPEAEKGLISQLI